METRSLLIETDSRGVVTLTMNRPDRHNAFDDTMIAELQQALDGIDKNESIRLLVLRAAGKSFSAGADLNWMSRMAEYDDQQNRADSMQLAQMMKSLNSLSKPVIAVVQGASFGGGVGLVACCDIAIASTAASFCLSEVRLGLIPAVISPYVIGAIGERQARRYFLTAEKFDAAQALSIGLIHQLVDQEVLDKTVENVITELLRGGPAAQSAAKDLIHHVSRLAVDDRLIEFTAEKIADIRSSAEGREGLSAFLQKRSASWNKE